jgi:hypothetical protein
MSGKITGVIRGRIALLMNRTLFEDYLRYPLRGLPVVPFEDYTCGTLFEDYLRYPLRGLPAVPSSRITCGLSASGDPNPHLHYPSDLIRLAPDGIFPPVCFSEQARTSMELVPCSLSFVKFDSLLYTTGQKNTLSKAEGHLLPGMGEFRTGLRKI